MLAAVDMCSKAVMRMGASFGRSVQSCLNWQRELFLNEFERDGLVIDLHLFFVLCGLWTSIIVTELRFYALPAFNSPAES